MNIIIEVNGLNQCDFVQNGYWVRNPSVELCGVNDSDDCKVNVIQWLKDLEPVPFENISDFEGQVPLVVDQIDLFIKELEGMDVITQTFSTDTIFISVRAIAKYSSDYVFDPADFQ